MRPSEQCRGLLWHAYTGRRLAPFRRDLERFPSLPVEARRADLARRMRRQLATFGARRDALSGWAEAGGIDSDDELLAAWRELPSLTKEDLRVRFHPERLFEQGLTGFVTYTGGSTGEPRPFLIDGAGHLSRHAGMVHCRAQIGWYPGLATGCVWGSPRDVGQAGQPRARLSNVINGRFLIDGYRLDDGTVEAMLAVAGRVKPFALYGYPSMLAFVAEGLLARGVRLEPGHVRCAWTGGEMVYREQAEAFEAAFGAPLLNYYGGHELSAMAWQPAPGESLRVVRPAVMVEVVDEHGAPVPPGRPGRLLWSDLVGQGTPCLRYDIGDIGIADPARTDESGIGAIAALDGRVAGLLKLPDGTTINCIYWNHLLKDYPEIRQFQVALVGDQRIEVRLVGEGFRPEREAALEGILKGFLWRVPFSLRWVEQLQRSAQGKLDLVVREEAW